MSKNKERDAWRLLEAAKRVATREGRLELENVRIFTNVEDLDFDSPVVAIGDWNTATRWDEATERHVDVDETPKRLSEAFERIGVEVAWSDCVTQCDGCEKLLNTQAWSYGWQPHYSVIDGHLSCNECLDIPAFLESIEGEASRAVNNPDIDPEEHDYFQVEEDLARGFHRGQDADPAKIAEALKARGLKRFLFKVDDIGQFDVHFSIWLHEDERETWEAEETPALTDDELNGPSVSEAAKRGLQAAAIAADSLPDGPGVKYVAISGDQVTDARLISPRDFVEKGIKP